MKAIVWAMVALLALANCAALPPVAWTAIGAVAGAVTATAKLDEALLDAYLSLKGKKVASATACTVESPNR